MKWEYKVFKLFSIAHIAVNEVEEDAIRANAETLREYGSEGWELVSVDNGIAYFKRPIEDRKPLYFTPEYFDKLNRDIFSQSANEVPTKQSYDD